jgi:AAA domain, putative AbiEii toxin, Type IV TA system
MRFKVLPPRSRPDASLIKSGFSGFLIRDDWDDWGEFQTQFQLYVHDEADKKPRAAGSLKIGQFGLGSEEFSYPNRFRPPVPDEFEQLDKSFFSLGQDANYYEVVGALGEERREELVAALRDVAADPSLFARAVAERVTNKSLLRDVTKETVMQRFSRLVRGDNLLTDFQFTYRMLRAGRRVVDLTFQVEPHSLPPTNIHVLIGRNGVGKTRCLHRMTRALVLGERNSDGGEFLADSKADLFSKLVSVAFSAFDPFGPIPETRSEPHLIGYEYVGLQADDWVEERHLDLDEVAEDGDNEEGDLLDEGEDGLAVNRLKTQDEVRQEFVDSAAACLVGPRRRRWRNALATLTADPMFEDHQLGEFALDDSNDSRSWRREIGARFEQLSSGHKIVLLTVTRLVELVDEKTLVLIDEPEAHLHPPLLAALVRAVSDLLVSRNGVAIVATHSPVVLQECPRACAWVINRSGNVTTAERPTIETFGENVGALTREVFRLEVARSGFHRLIKDTVKEAGHDYGEVLNRFEGQLGSEARAIAFGMCSAQDDEEDDSSDDDHHDDGED